MQKEILEQFDNITETFALLVAKGDKPEYPLLIFEETPLTTVELLNTAWNLYRIKTFLGSEKFGMVLSMSRNGGLCITELSLRCSKVETENLLGVIEDFCSDCLVKLGNND